MRNLQREKLAERGDETKREGETYRKYGKRGVTFRERQRHDRGGRNMVMSVF